MSTLLINSSDVWFSTAMNKEDDDSKAPLSNIAQLHGKSIALLLLDIQKDQQPQWKYLDFILSFVRFGLCNPHAGVRSFRKGCPFQKSPACEKSRSG